MDTVLGLSLTPTTAERVLVAGRDADGAVLSCDMVETLAGVGANAVAASEQVVEAVLQARAAAAAHGRQVHAVGVTWTDEAVAEAALVLEKLTDVGLDNVVPVRLRQAVEAAPTTVAHGAAVVSARSAAFPNVGAAVLPPDSVGAAGRGRVPLPYAGAAAALIAGAFTFVVSLSLAVSLQHIPQREFGQIEQVANTTEPIADRTLEQTLAPPAPADDVAELREPAGPEEAPAELDQPEVPAEEPDEQ